MNLDKTAAVPGHLRRWFKGLPWQCVLTHFSSRRPQTVAQKLEADLAVIQRKRAELEALEAQYAKDLSEARAVQEGDASQIAALEPVVQQDVRTTNFALFQQELRWAAPGCPDH